MICSIPSSCDALLNAHNSLCARSVCLAEWSWCLQLLVATVLVQPTFSHMLGAIVPIKMSRLLCQRNIGAQMRAKEQHLLLCCGSRIGWGNCRPHSLLHVSYHLSSYRESPTNSLKSLERVTGERERERVRERERIVRWEDKRLNPWPMIKWERK